MISGSSKIQFGEKPFSRPVREGLARQYGLPLKLSELHPDSVDPVADAIINAFGKGGTVHIEDTPAVEGEEVKPGVHALKLDVFQTMAKRLGLILVPVESPEGDDCDEYIPTYRN